MKKAIIFDMDGVIVDSEIVYMQRVVEFTDLFGERPNHKELCDNLVGVSSNSWWEWLSNKCGLKNVEVTKRKYEEYTSKKQKVDYVDIFRKEIYQLIDYCKNNQIKMAVASSSPKEHIISVLNDCGILNEFEIIVSGEEFIESKPNPEIYQYTVKELGVESNEALVIEDSTIGIIAAKAAGLSCLALADDRFNFRQDKADAIINSLAEAIRYIK